MNYNFFLAQYHKILRQIAYCAKFKNQLGSSIEVVPYQPANWYSEIGAQKKLYQLEKKDYQISTIGDL